MENILIDLLFFYTHLTLEHYYTVKYGVLKNEHI